MYKTHAACILPASLAESLYPTIISYLPLIRDVYSGISKSSFKTVDDLFKSSKVSNKGTTLSSGLTPASYYNKIQGLINYER